MLCVRVLCLERYAGLQLRSDSSLSVIARKSYVWLPRWRCLNLDVWFLDFCLWGRMKSEVFKRKVDSRYELFAGILDAAVRLQKPEVQLKRISRHLRTRITKCIEVDGGIFKQLLRTVRNFSPLLNRFFI